MYCLRLYKNNVGVNYFYFYLTKLIKVILFYKYYDDL